MDWIRDNWIWIVIGIFFVWTYFKMRGGRGRHSTHEGHQRPGAHGGERGAHGLERGAHGREHEGRGAGPEGHSGCCGGREASTDPRKEESVVR